MVISRAVIQAWQTADTHTEDTRERARHKEHWRDGGHTKETPGSQKGDAGIAQKTEGARQTRATQGDTRNTRGRRETRIPKTPENERDARDTGENRDTQKRHRGHRREMQG